MAASSTGETRQPRGADVHPPHRPKQLRAGRPGLRGQPASERVGGRGAADGCARAGKVSEPARARDCRLVCCFWDTRGGWGWGGIDRGVVKRPEFVASGVPAATSIDSIVATGSVLVHVRVRAAAAAATAAAVAAAASRRAQHAPRGISAAKHAPASRAITSGSGRRQLQARPPGSALAVRHQAARGKRFHTQKISSFKN